MAGFSRASMPAEFYDITSDKLLVQPEPQYGYASVYLNSLRASLNVPAGLGLAGREAPASGSDYSSAERDRLLLSSPMSTDLMAVAHDFSATPGSTLRINRPSFANTTYTQASRIIPVGSSISTTAIAVSSEQTNLTLFRFGGPYDSTNSRVAPFGIESFDANMGLHKAASIVGTHMRRDFHRFLDAVMVALLDTAATATYPDGMSAVNDATATGMFPITMEQISRTEQLMDEANLPTFGDGFRVLVLTPTQCKQLKDDPQFQRYSEFHKEYNALFPNYLKSIGKFHIFKSNTLSTTANSSSVNIHYGHAIAPGVLMGGMGRPARVVPSTDDNFGETVKVVWLADLAFGLADSRFVYSVRSSA